MSITWFSRGRGLMVRCNGTDTEDCPAKYQCGLIIAKNVRAWIAKHDKWGRGLRKGRKRCDLCPKCLAIERELHKTEKAASEERKAARRAAKKAKWSGEPKPKRQRKKSPASPEASPSPSADSAQAPAT